MAAVQRWVGGQQALADKAGVSLSTAKSWALKGTEIGLFVAGRLCAGTGLSLGYLLGGKAETEKDLEVEMLRFEEAKQAFAIPSSGPERKEARTNVISEAQRQLDELAESLASGSLPSEAEVSMLPRYAVEASAGSGRQADLVPEVERVPFRRDWLRERGINPGFAEILTNRGDSMLGEIEDGAPMLIDTEPGKPVVSGYIYVFILEGDVLVKRLSRNVDGTVDLISSNPLYPKQTITQDRLDQLTVRGRVHWTGRWL